MSKQTQTKTEKQLEHIIQLIPIARPATHINDAEIRALICRSCQVLLDDYSEESDLNPLKAMILQTFSSGTGVTDAFPVFDKERDDLSIYWNTMVQKQVMTFEHESFLVMNWNNNKSSRD
jgi:hypothetical protein